MSNTEYVTNGISMLPEDWEVVDAVAEKHGNGRSSAMRMIVRNHPVAERMIALGQARMLGYITVEEAVEELANIAAMLPLPITLTDKAKVFIDSASEEE